MTPNVFRAAVGLYVLILGTLVAVYISVSLVHVQVAAYVQGPPTLKQGGPNALRGMVINAPTGQLFTGATTRFVLNPGDAQVVVGEGETAAHGYVHTTLDVSTAPVGTHPLALRAEHPLIESFETQSSVEVQAPEDRRPWVEFSTRAPDGSEPVRALSAWTGELRVEPMADHVELIRGLPNKVVLRVVDQAGEPVPATVEFLKLEGLLDGAAPTSVTTDEFGLATVTVHPVGGFRWELKATSSGREIPLTGQGKVSFATVPAQYSLEMIHHYLAPGGEADGQVSTLHQSGGMMVDLYADGQWVFAEAFRISPSGAGLRVQAPATVRPKLWHVQVYDDVFGAGKAWDSRWVAVSPDGTCRRALDPTLGLLAEVERHAVFAQGVRRLMSSGPPVSEARCNELLGALLQGFPPHFSEARLMFNSKAGAEKELDVWKADVKAWLHILIGFALLLGFGVVLVFVGQGVAVAKAQRRMLQEVDLELQGDGQLDSGWDRLAYGGRVALMIGTIVLFCAGLLMVLKFM